MGNTWENMGKSMEMLSPEKAGKIIELGILQQFTVGLQRL